LALNSQIKTISEIHTQYLTPNNADLLVHFVWCQWKFCFRYFISNHSTVFCFYRVRNRARRTRLVVSSELNLATSYNQRQMRRS